MSVKLECRVVFNLSLSTLTSNSLSRQAKAKRTKGSRTKKRGERENPGEENKERKKEEGDVRGCMLCGATARKDPVVFARSPSPR
jgi:hypothetical protein